MKYSIVALLFLTGLLNGQEPKYYTGVPADGTRPSVMTATNIERVGAYPSVIHLKGNVKVRTCTATTKKRGKPICGGFILLQADELTYHEDTGKMEANGSVSLTPSLREPTI
jgi:lipopolysaccharide assembly outer membrane protein LptD (OstA)